MHSSPRLPVQGLFLAAMLLFGVYFIVQRWLPLPDELLGWPTSKVLKLLLGALFCVAILILYVRANRKTL